MSTSGLVYDTSEVEVGRVYEYLPPLGDGTELVAYQILFEPSQ